MKYKNCSAKKILLVNTIFAVLATLLFASCGGGGGGGASVAVTTPGQTASTPVATYAEVKASDLDAYLKSQDPNNAATAYSIKVTDLDTSNSTQLKDILKANPTKYVDLSATQLPDGITDFRNGFSSCTTLTKAPALPSGVTNLTNCFSGCTSLVEAPTIPTGVTNLTACFSQCSSLVEAPTIPNTVNSMNSCFLNCTSLTTVPNISTSATNMSFCFSGCTSLTQVPDIPESVDNMTNCFQKCSALEAVRIRTTKVAYGKWDKCFKDSKADILITVPVTNPTDGVKTNITDWPCHSHLTNVVVAQAE